MARLIITGTDWKTFSVGLATFSKPDARWASQEGRWVTLMLVFFEVSVLVWRYKSKKPRWFHLSPDNPAHKMSILKNPEPIITTKDRA